MPQETFYTAFYGLKATPFHVTPDPDILLLTEPHKHALAAIHYAVAARKGFAVVTGEVGVGKTSVLRAALDRLDPAEIKLVYLFDARLDSAALYRSILQELGPVPERDAEILPALHTALVDRHERGIAVVLAVDEAHNMLERTLEDLRMLSNLETRTEKLLQIILVGQPELDQMLDRPSLRQLRQRIAVRAAIPPLGYRQRLLYLDYRLRAAGYKGERPLFTAAARRYIAATSDGIPRQLNILCDNALINGFGHQAPRITLAIVREAERDIRTISPRKRSWRRAALAGLAIAAGAASIVGMRYRAIDLPSITAATGPAPDPVAAQPANAAVGARDTPQSRSAPSTPPQSGSSQPAGPPIEAEPLAAATPVPPVAIGPQPAAAVDPARIATAPEPARRWIRFTPRSGDRLVRICAQIYHQACDDQTIHRIRAANPELGSGKFVMAGQTVLFPAEEARRPDELMMIRTTGTSSPQRRKRSFGGRRDCHVEAV